MAAEPEQDGQAPQVADPEEYNQTQRLRAINRARQRVEDTLEQSMVRLVTDPDFDESDRRQVVRAVVYSYVSNVFWLSVEADEEGLVQDTKLGTVRMDPPDEFVRLTKEKSRGYPRVIGSPDLKPYVYIVKGLAGFLAAPEVFEKTWGMQVQDRHAEPQRVEHTEETYMPVHISKNAFHAANGFLSKAGVDVALDQGKPHGEI